MPKRTDRAARAHSRCSHPAVAPATLLFWLVSIGVAGAAPDATWLERQAPWGLLLLALWIALAWALTRPRTFDRLVGAATPGTLGAIRVLVCGRLFFFVLGESGLPSLASMPDSLRRPMGVMDVLWALPLGLDALVHSPEALGLLRTGTLVLLFLATIGWRTRLVVPLGALGAFLVAGLLRKYSFFWHQDLVALYLSGVLSLTPCGDGWSVDRLLAVARGRAAPPPERQAPAYGWARYACWTVLSLVYVAAGLSKLRNGGMYWWNGTTIRRVFLTDSLNPMQFDWGLSLHLAYMPDVVFAVLGFLAVWGEVAYGLVLVWPRVRLVLPAMMGLMHVGIVFLQNILFLDLILLQLLFVDFTKVRKWLGRRVGAPIRVTFDGRCERCRRAADVLHRLDLFERLRLEDVGQTASPGVADAPMRVGAAGDVSQGLALYRRVALVLPLGWLVAPFLWLPGMAAAAPRLVAWLTNARTATPVCAEHGPAAARDASAVTPAALGAPRVSRGGPLAVAALAASMLTIWVHEVEFFPLTALQMYSQPVWRSHDPLVFYRVLAVRESGDASRAAWDEVAGPYARNARYRAFLWNFHGNPAQAERLRSFMTAMGEDYNRHAPVGRRITRLEAQTWQSAWEDPRAGQLVGRLAVELTLPPHPSVAASAPDAPSSGS